MHVALSIVLKLSRSTVNNWISPNCPGHWNLSGHVDGINFFFYGKLVCNTHTDNIMWSRFMLIFKWQWIRLIFPFCVTAQGMNDTLMNVFGYFFENHPEYLLLNHIFSSIFEPLKLHFVREESHNWLVKQNHILYLIFAMLTTNWPAVHLGLLVMQNLL